MARIRNIKPEFFEDETMATLPRDARLLFVGIWTRCDLQGVFEWNVKVITAAIFPHDEDIDAAHVTEWLDRLVAMGRIARFEVDGKRYGFVRHFGDHQAISKSERDIGAKYPAPTVSKTVEAPVSVDVSKTVYKTVSETVSTTVSQTVPKTQDVGHRTKDVGRGTSARGTATGQNGQPDNRTAGQHAPTEDDEDPIQGMIIQVSPAQPVSKNQTTPVPATPSDLLASLGGMIDWYRNASGRQEAEADIAAALLLCRPDELQAAVRWGFAKMGERIRTRELMDAVRGWRSEQVIAALNPPDLKLKRALAILADLGEDEVRKRLGLVCAMPVAEVFGINPRAAYELVELIDGGDHAA